MKFNRIVETLLPLNFAPENSIVFKSGVIIYWLREGAKVNVDHIRDYTGYKIKEIETIVLNLTDCDIIKEGKLDSNIQVEINNFIEFVLMAMEGAGLIKQDFQEENPVKKKSPVSGKSVSKKRTLLPSVLMKVHIDNVRYDVMPVKLDGRIVTGKVNKSSELYKQGDIVTFDISDIIRFDHKSVARTEQIKSKMIQAVQPW